ncbi:MAG TPA: hypothetical protein VF599_13425 [Pyrinomonadaceae bacterium]|jgi:hypothetical protein
MTTETTDIGAVTSLSAPEEQHLLLLFLPLKHGSKPPLESDGISTLHTLFSGSPPADSTAQSDPRPATGVHFFMIYALAAGAEQNPPPPFPAFQVPPPNPDTKEPRDLAVVLSIYDADFGPYIGAFTSSPTFSALLDATVLQSLDETGFVDPDDPTSAQGILANGGTFANPDAFVALLMRYNWADPTRPAATSPTNIANPNPDWKPYFLGATFPGLTIGKILNTSNGYPNALELYPVKAPPIDFATSTPPV